MEPIKLKTPLTDIDISKLRTGDYVSITGEIYTARDSAHARMVKTLNEGKEIPIDLKGQIIYFAGPSPAKPGQPVGSIGPTTSERMDAYSPKLIEVGLKGMIGKGQRSQDVINAMKKYKCVYLAATGGAAALLAKRVKKAEVVAYEDLGPEAIRKLYVEDFPAIVVNDIQGNDLYKEGQKKYEQNNF